MMLKDLHGSPGRCKEVWQGFNFFIFQEMLERLDFYLGKLYTLRVNLKMIDAIMRQA